MYTKPIIKVLTVTVEAKYVDNLSRKTEEHMNDGWHLSNIVFNSIQDKYVLLFTRNDWSS